jgi:hypothetical protein
MSNIVCITSTANVGCTFVDWSIHFLYGAVDSYSFDKNAWLALSMDPVTKTNAHGHSKNQPFGYQQTKTFLQELNNAVDSKLATVYPLPLLIDTSAKELNIIPPLNTELYDKIVHQQANDYNQLVNYCLDQNIKTIYIATNPQSTLYYREVRALGRLIFETRNSTGTADTINHLDSLFFNENIQKDTIWDRRESLALAYRPFDYAHHEIFPMGFSKPYLRIDCQSLWYDGSRSLQKIMSYLNLSIDQRRWDLWLPIYYKWQQLQLDLLEFNFNCKHIVEAVVNGWYYEIDLTFDQEVVVQHCLIYQFGLNLKTWQLKKFPNNTQELHKLLEPNIHKSV